MESKSTHVGLYTIVPKQVSENARAFTTLQLYLARDLTLRYLIPASGLSDRTV